MSALIHLGDVRDVQACLPARRFHAIVTSPPYWGLRDYKIDPRAWDGDPACEHEWVVTVTPPRKTDDGATGSALTGSTATQEQTQRSSSSCAKCSAWLGSLGLEPTPDLYVRHLVEVLRGVRRVLRDDGVLWLNLGDSYASTDGRAKGGADGGLLGERGDEAHLRNRVAGVADLKPLDLVGIPWRVATALQADGWYLRMDVVWAKNNSMPESVRGWRWERCRVKTEKAPQEWNGYGAESNRRLPDASGGVVHSPKAKWSPCPGCDKCKPNDGYVLRKGAWRPTRAHEFFFMLSKSDDYYCDGEAVKEAATYGNHARNLHDNGPRDVPPGEPPHRGIRHAAGVDAGRNIRSVWSITTQPSNWDFCSACSRFYEGKLRPPVVDEHGVPIRRRHKKRKHTDGTEDYLFSVEEVERDAGTPIDRKKCKKVCACGRSDAWVDHFALMPPALAEKCIRASTPEKCCGACGAPWARVVDREAMVIARSNRGAQVGNRTYSSGTMLKPATTTTTTGFRPTCTCNAPSAPARVFDPFSGAGTTGVVALSLGRDYEGAELRAEYVTLSDERMKRSGREQRTFDLAVAE